MFDGMDVVLGVCMNSVVILFHAACAAGSYAERGDPCTLCPDNSDSSSGSEICTCDLGYYRASGEGPSYACTSEDSM